MMCPEQIGGAVGACFRFFARVKKEIAPVHRATAKTRSFLIIIVIQWLLGVSKMLVSNAR